MKIATHVLLFNQDKWIMKNIENAYNYVDKIYISYSEKPWNYNINARNQYKNIINLDIIKNSKFFDKIVLIEGDWNTEEEQRNTCIEFAKKDNIDYLITHDADEFYTNSGFRDLVKGIIDNPEFDYYTTPWVTFWKDFDNVICDDKNNLVIGYPEIAINLNRGIKFKRCRIPTGDKIKRLNSLCYHASYVLSDDECLTKINTWGHSHQFDTKKWYNDKWLNWNESVTCLHPISPCIWFNTKKYDINDLPEILKK